MREGAMPKETLSPSKPELLAELWPPATAQVLVPNTADVGSYQHDTILLPVAPSVGNSNHFPLSNTDSSAALPSLLSSDSSASVKGTGQCWSTAASVVKLLC